METGRIVEQGQVAYIHVEASKLELDLHVILERDTLPCAEVKVKAMRYRARPTTRRQGARGLCFEEERPREVDGVAVGLDVSNVIHNSP